MHQSLVRLTTLALAAAFCLQAQASNVQRVPIVDPVFRIPAYTLTAPANWIAGGTTFPPSSCSAATNIVAKAVSPDGSAGWYLLPTTAWAWGAGTRPTSDCLPWQHDVSARDYLTYLVRIEKVGFVSEVPLAESERMTAQHPGQTVDQAAYRVRYSIGKMQMTGIFRVSVICSTFNSLGVGASHVCTATARRTFAPLAKFDAMRPALDAISMQVNPAWMNAWANAMATRMRNLYGAETQAALAQGRLAHASLMQQHDAFMASQQAGADRRNVAFAAGQYQKQNNNDNFVDHILDCTRSYGPGYRVSSENCPNRQTY
jgi:hypothetical protein